MATIYQCDCCGRDFVSPLDTLAKIKLPEEVGGLNEWREIDLCKNCLSNLWAWLHVE
jgi:hypothetical protein